jgi:hypothetical protein
MMRSEIMVMWNQNARNSMPTGIQGICRNLWMTSPRDYWNRAATIVGSAPKKSLGWGGRGDETEDDASSYCQLIWKKEYFPIFLIFISLLQNVNEAGVSR